MGRSITWGLIAAAVLACTGLLLAEPEALVPTRNETFSMLETGNYAKLEEITGRLRQVRLGFYNGWPPLRVLYGNLSFSTTDTAVWDKYIGLLKKWAVAYPESPTPRIALANLYSDYAWEARGTGYADSVTPEGQQRFMERLKLAQAKLDEAKALSTGDAEAYYLQLVLDKALGQPQGQDGGRLCEGTGP